MNKTNNDAFGRMLLLQHATGEQLSEIIEREDNYIDTGSVPGMYFFDHRKWQPVEKEAVKHVKGRILDVGCGAGRHALYFQGKGFDVTGIDISPGAVKVCKARGLKSALVRGVAELSKFSRGRFETIVMLGNNFGLLGDPASARVILAELFRITNENGRIIAGTRNPYETRNPDHLAYHRFNKKRGRMPGQLRIRARFGNTVGEWFDYLFVSPKEMESILEGTGWKIDRYFGETNCNYFALITKRSSD